VKRTVALLLLVVLSAALVVACGGDDDDDDGGSTSTPTSTPTSTSTPDDDDDGGELFGGTPVDQFFAINCAACHGADRQGIVGPALTKDVLTESDDFYFDTIANGREGTVMPAWRDAGPLNDEEISALVTFLKTTDP
jgi:mono/diheme cytochrome c family protein